MDTNLKLYVVEITYQAYVLAPDYTRAAQLEGDIKRWESPEVTVRSGDVILHNWQPPERCNVYHEGPHDITLVEARQNYPVGYD